MAGKITLAEVKSGTADIVDLLKINALLDFEAAQVPTDKETRK